MNTSFVFLRPEVCTKAFVEHTLAFFEQANICVDDIAVISTDEARRHQWIDRHYATIHTFAFADSDELTALIANRDEVKSIFHAYFHELWDTVVREGRLLSAKDAMTVLGNLSPRELSQRWWGNGDFHPANTTTALGCAPMKLFSGLYVMRLAPEGNLYVVNGFYPAIYETCTAADKSASVCRLSVSWPESTYTWEQFDSEVVGRPGDPSSSSSTVSSYPATSLRHALYHQSEAFGVHMIKDAWAAPSRNDCAPVVMSAVEAAAGPLEALAARCSWTNLGPESDGFGRQLLQEGIPLPFVLRLLRNPVLLQSGEVVSAFDLTAGLTSSQAVRLVSNLYVESEHVTQEKPGALSILDIPPLQEAEELRQPELRDSAVLLVKPHARQPKVIALLEEVLQREAQEHGLTIDAVVEVGAELADGKALVERHYNVEAFYATEAAPASIALTSAVEDAFSDTFGVKWADAVGGGRVFNAAAALHTLGGLSPAQLYQQWFVQEEKHRKLQLLNGAWVCRVAAPRHHDTSSSADEPFFVINGFYPYLRETITSANAVTRCYALSWPETSEEAESGTSAGTQRLHTSIFGGLLCTLKAHWQELGLPHPPDSVNDGFALSRGAAEAARMRHIWLGTPLDEDALYREALRPRGVSAAPLMRWLANPLLASAASPEKQRAFDLLAGGCTSEVVRVAREVEQQQLRGGDSDGAAAVNRAVVLLHPPAATAKAIQHVRSVLAGGGVSVKAEGDVFAREASARMLGTAAMRGAAVLSSLGGEQLLAAVSPEATEGFRQAFGKDWADFAEIITGAGVACGELEVTPTALMKTWSDCDPVRLARHCHVAFVPAYQRYIVNGFYPYLEERYTDPGARAHYFDVEWKESRWTWSDFNTVVIGDCDIAAAVAGSLQRSLSEGWRELDLPERPCHRAQVSISASTGPLEGIADRVVWLPNDDGAVARSSFDERFLADPVVQRFVAEGVPVGTVAYYAAGYRSVVLDGTRAQERAMLREISTHQQTSECVRRLKTVSANIQSACRQQYGFFWVQPAACVTTTDFAAAIPALLATHNVHIRSQGELSVDEAETKALLHGPFTALYRNAWVRAASAMPLTAEEKHLFLSYFGISWETAVQLSTVINAKEAVGRFGEARILHWWDEAPRKVCLSESLYVGYMELEGLYVVNGFYPYVQSRLHGGSRRTMWFSVSWDTAQMTWADFQTRVIGAQDPAQALPGSLRRHLHDNWELYGLATPTDAMESGLQASASPLEAVADRCLWWNLQPEQDVLGHLLLQHGVSIDFLYNILQNPPVYSRGCVGATIESVSDAFSLLPHDPVALIQALRLWQSATHVALLPSEGAAIASPRPLPLPKDDPRAWEVVPTVAQQREALVARQSTFTATAYPALPLDSLTVLAPAGGPETGEAAPLAEATAAYCLLSLSPTFLAATGVSDSDSGGEAAATRANTDLLKALVKDVLASHGVSVVYEGTQGQAAAEARRLFDGQHRRLLQYAMHDGAAELLSVRRYRETLERTFPDTLEPASLLNAVRLAEAFDLSPSKVNEVWKCCSPIVRIDSELFVGKVPADDLLVVNGFALQERNAFYAAPHPRHFLLVQWDEQRLSYGDFVEKVVGDAHVACAAAGTLHAALRDKWRQLGFSGAPHPYLGVIHASNSALMAMHDRQLWMPEGLDFGRDPLGRRAMQEASVSPYILQWALSNPREEPGSGSFAVGRALASRESSGDDDSEPAARLMDVMAYQGTEVTLRLLGSLEVNYRCQQGQQRSAVRNTAFLLVKPHALGRRFARCVEAVLAKHMIRIDDEGDITGTTLHQKGLLRSLYPASAAYAVRKPCDVILSDEERLLIEQQFGVAWPDMVQDGLVYNAYDALQKLGGVSPQHLYVCWRVSRYHIEVRPDLELTFLEDHGIYVANGYFPALKQSFESPHALLHWYVVSWPESALTWAQFQSDVVGHRDPAKAAGTIRGKLYANWRRYGLHATPDRIQNGLHVSSGPWHAMAERLQVLPSSHLDRDPLGDLLLHRNVHRGLVRAWLANPDIVACGIRAGVFEHLAGYDTTQVADLVTTVSDNVRRIEKSRRAAAEPAVAAAAVAGSPVEEAETPGSALRQHPSPTSAEGDVVPAGQLDAAAVDDGDSEDAADLISEDAIAHRNVAVLLIKPHIASSPAALQLLRDVLKQQQRGLRVLSETVRKDGLSPAAAMRTIDRMYFTEAFYALHSSLGAAVATSESEFSSEPFQGRFAEAFDGECWRTAVATGRVLSAAEAMERLRLTPQELYEASLRDGSTLTVGRSLSLTQVLVRDGDEDGGAARYYVANAGYPLAREHLQCDPATDGCEAGEMRVIVVAWDERDLPWRRFKTDVIGSEDPAAASPMSFRAELLRRWREVGLAAPPSQLDNGVRVSDGPLQAYAERLAWFGGGSGSIPDTLSRSLSAAEADAALLVDWSENPLVDLGNGEDVKRLFDVLYEADTSAVAAFAKLVQEGSTACGEDGSEGPRRRVVVLTDRNNLHPHLSTTGKYAALFARRPGENPLHLSGPRGATAHIAHDSSGQRSVAAVDEAVDIPTATFSHRSGRANNAVAGIATAAKAADDGALTEERRGEGEVLTQSPVDAAAGKPRQRLQAAKARDAILHARTAAEVQALWGYYLALGEKGTIGCHSDSNDDTARKSTGATTATAAPRPTIDAGSFKADFASLEMFGAPLPRHQVKTLFAAAEARGGRMHFDEFARALAFYQAM